MPTYEFRCGDTGKMFEVRYKTYAEYDPESVRSPYTGTYHVTRIIRKVALKRKGGLGALMDGDEDSLAALENADPAMLGQTLREMADETGEDMGPEFSDIVGRLEAGQSPDEIEASLPSLADE